MAVRELFVRWIFLGLLALMAPLAHAVSVSPTSFTLAAGSTRDVAVSNVRGTLTVTNSTPGVLTLTRLSTSKYRIQGVAAGTGEVVFKDSRSTVTVRVTVTAPAAAVLTGRLLASNCFQCHGTNGSGGFDRLAGKNASELYSELKAFATGREDADGIMAAHAMGFSDEQLRAIAAYFSSIR